MAIENISNIKSMVRRLISRLALVFVVTLGMLIPVSCVDELYTDVIKGPNGENLYGPFSIDVPISADGNESKTRSSFDSDNFMITSAWVGVFEVGTGRLIGMQKQAFDPNQTGFANTSHTEGTGDQFKITLHNLYFNDDYANVYIAGVANYTGVDGSAISVYDSNGTATTLEEALDNITCFKDYYRIQVSTASAEAAMGDKNHPLISGFMGKGGHGNFSVDEEGTVQTNNKNVAEIALFDVKKRAVVKDALNGNFLHLRRQYSHINAQIEVDMRTFQKFENVTFKVYNLPKYVFLSENTMVENVEDYNSESWLNVTPAASDLFGDAGYIKSTPVIAEGDKISETDEAVFFMNDDDVMSVSSASNTTTVKFGYWHYENKHWGLSSVKSLYDREKRFGTSDVFTSLCATESDPFNNNATYMVLSADVKSGSYEGRADFIIHEGYCSLANGESNTTDLASASRDFATFRNTNYTYKINIKGINDIIVKVTSDDGLDHNAGVGGDFWNNDTEKVSVDKDGDRYDVYIPDGKLYWCIDNGDGTYFGKRLDVSDPELYAMYSNAYPSNSDIVETIPTDNDFYNGITINGVSLSEYTSTRSIPTNAVLRFARGKEGERNTLYICGVVRSTDATTTLHSVYSFIQSDIKELKTPDIQMPNAPADGMLMAGIHDHTITWDPVKYANRYQITFTSSEHTKAGCQPYVVTLAPGQSVDKDNDGYIVTLNQDAGGRLSFRLRYANSKNGLLRLFNTSQSDNVRGTFEVIALSDDGLRSQPATLSKTYSNPEWDFSSADWQSAAKNALGGAATGTFAVNTTFTVKHLTFYAGNNDKNQYGKSGNYYYFAGGGSGSKDIRGFKFHAVSKGSIRVWTTANNSGTVNTDRYVDVETANGKITSAKATTRAPGNIDTSTNTSLKIEKVLPGDMNYDYDTPNVWVYPNGSIYIYHIRFIPED